MHLDDERLQRLLHGELAHDAEKAARAHVAACAECGRRLADAEREEREVHALLAAVDDPPPPADAEAIAAMARAPSSPRHHDRARHHAPVHREHGFRWAAGLLLALIVAGGAYAVPGSPVRGWMEAAVAWIGGGSQPAPRAPEHDRRLAGVAVSPGDEFAIVFISAQSEGRAEVALTDDADVVVNSASGAASFASEAGRLVIDNAGSTATFEIRIPRSAPRVEIRVGDRQVFLKKGALVTADVAAGADGRYVLSLTSGGP